MRLQTLTQHLNRTLLAGTIFCAVSQAAIVLDLPSITMQSTDPTQLGRLSRNAVPSDWATLEPFPGVVNPTLVFHYRTFNLNITALTGRYLQILIDDPQGVFFASAYAGAYTPNPTAANRGLDTNYLGDAGFSGNPFGNPGFFQILVPSSVSNIVFVVNEVPSNLGLGQPFGLLVEGFANQNFSDPVGVPEPSSFLLFSSAGAFGIYVRRRRLSAAA